MKIEKNALGNNTRIVRNEGRGLVDRKLVEAPPPLIFIAGRPKVALRFWFLVILDVARCYLWLFTLYKNR